MPRPSSRRRKRYLGGMDWFVRALDCRTRAVTGTGAYAQVALALRGRLDADRLRERLRACLAGNPVLSGRCRRHPLNLAPYWAVPRRACGGDLPLVELPADAPREGELLPASLVDAVNQPLPDRWRVAFTLAQSGERSFLAMRFDHQVLDAVGAERLWASLAASAPPAALSLGDGRAHLDHWREKFRSGQVVNRVLRGLRGPEPPVAFAMPVSHGGRPSRFVFRSFSPARTSAILERAERQVGYLMLFPFLLSAAVGAFHALCRKAGRTGGHYVVPVTMDARRAEHAGAVFFNHLSFHFYRFERAACDDPAGLRKQAAAQFYRQTRDRVADHVAQAGYLMRILPAAWLGWLMEWPLSGRLGSFSFALLAGDAFTSETFLGVPVDGVYHMPRVPTPPGLGVYFTRYRGGLNLVLSYLDGMIDATEAGGLADTLVAQLDPEIRA